MPLPPGVRRLFRFPRRSARAIAADVDEELRFHLDLRADELAARQGLDPAAARAEALRQFGDLEDARRYLERTGRGTELAARVREALGTLGQDLRLAWRGVRARPGFAAAVVVTLALGIGVNAAVFGAVDRLLFRAPPLLPEPARVHRVYMALPTPDGGGEMFLEAIPYARYAELAAGTRAFTRTTLAAAATLAVGTGEHARETSVGVVTASFFGFFDAPPALGRYFTAREDVPPAGTPVAVLSHAAWQARHGGRPDALGATIRIGATDYTIIGVAPRGFVGLWPDRPPVAFVPLSAAVVGWRDRAAPGETWWTDRTRAWAEMLVERKPGVTAAAASADLTRAVRRSFEAEVGGTLPYQPRAIAAPVLQERGPNQTSAARVAALVGGTALLVLLIACANVANLMLARALRRRREVAVRLALGVSRARLLSHVLAESALLALLGGVAGLLAAQGGGAALQTAFLPPGADAPSLGDARTLGFVGAVVVVAGLVTALAAAWQARRADLTRALRVGAGEGAGHRSRARVALLVTQGALSMLLLVGAGLFVRSLRNVSELRLGYDVDPVLVVGLHMRGASLDSVGEVGLRDRLLATARRLPMVDRATLHLTLPLRDMWLFGLGVPGADPAAMRRAHEFLANVVSPDYFAAVGTRIVRGRGIEAQDVAGAPGAVVVSDALARLLWPGKDPIGQCVRVEADPACGRVVGVAEDILSARLAGDPGLEYYLAAAQHAPGQTGLVVRTRGDAARWADAVRRALQAELPGDAYLTATPFAEIVGEHTRSWRLGATMFVAFGVLALSLAAVGLYAVVAHDVERRAHEVGVRVALGAERGNVVWMVVRHGVVLGAVGVVIGGALALTAAGRVAPLLFEVSPRDPLVYALVAALMLGVAAVASLIPARRAARVDPTVALRSE